MGDLASAADAFDATSTAPPGTLAAAADKFDSIKPESAPAQSKQATNTPTPADPNAAAYVYRTPTHGRGTQTSPMAPTEAATSSLTSGGASILGGFTGLGTAIGQMSADSRDALKGLVTGDTTAVKSILSGKSLANAREQGGAAASQFQEDHAWQPTSPDAANMVRISNMPGAAMGKAADYAGQAASDITGSPTVGAGVKTAVSMLPAIALHKATEGGKAAPVERPVPPPGVTAPAAEATTAASAPAPAQASPGAAPAVSAPVASPAPAVPPIAPEITVPRENPSMPETAPTPANVQANIDALKKVGIENIRNSAVEMNPKEASSQYITSKASQEPYGAGMTAQINHEKGALENHFGNIEQTAGGDVVRYGTPEQVQDQIKTGQTIKQALQAGHDNWVQQGHDLYTQADAATGGKPVNLPTLNDYLGNSSNFVYEAENGLKNGVQGYLSRAKLLNPDGSVAPMSVQDAEGVRQYINSKFNPDTKMVSKDMKSAIDNDVFSQVGGPTYQAARAHWAQGIQTYENPKAMGDLLGDQGVNQKIPDENVLPKIAGLPQSQFDHVVGTLRNDGQVGAVNQIQTSLVNQIKRAGQSAVNEPWNSIAAAKTAANLSGKLASAFADKPELLQKINDGIAAGNIVHIPTKYPGAAVQTQLLQNKFSENALQKTATGAGSVVGGTMGSIFGPGGTAAGGAAGAMLGEHLGAKGANAARMARQTKQLGQEIQYNQGMTGLPK